MAATDRDRRAEALDWARRIDDPGFADWEAHAAWLESDPRNLAAFDTISALIADATDGLTAPAPRIGAPIAVNDNRRAEPQQKSGGRRWMAGLAIAAGAALAVTTIPWLRSTARKPYVVQTAPGQRSKLMLADGTQIALNGATVLRLDRADRRTAVVERGEAYFIVVHDAAHPFTVRAGDAIVRDVGTAFDVARDGAQTEIAVGEGAVIYDPASAAVRLTAGQAIRIDAGGVSMQQLAARGVGGWRAGRLTFQDAALADVAADVARSVGVPITVDPGIAGRRFSGVIMIDRDQARMMRRIAAVADVAVRADGAGWRLVPPQT